MSEPRNHHYVSQVLSGKFMSSERCIYTYNKHHKYNQFRTKNTTKSLFSKRDINSERRYDGSIDHSTVESELN